MMSMIHQELLYDILEQSLLSAGTVEPFTYILYRIHAAAFCKYAILDIIGTKSLPYPRLITQYMYEPEPVILFTSDQISWSDTL